MLDKPGDPVMVYNQLPGEIPHGWKFIKIGPDGKLYVPVGAPCNICEPSDQFAQIRRINLDGSGPEVVARGVRNTVGFDFHPKTKELWFTDNQRDWLSEDLPQDELNRLSKPGQQHFGYPYCHQGDFADPEFGWGKSCADYVKPALLLGAHSAPLGMRFYTGKMFPEKYRNAIFVARHGPCTRAASATTRTSPAASRCRGWPTSARTISSRRCGSTRAGRGSVMPGPWPPSCSD